MLKFKLNVAERKTLAKRMEELTGIHPYYTKAPLYSYDIGSYTIDRNGNLLVEPENADAELLTTLLNEGLIRGGESIESTDDQPEDTEPDRSFGGGACNRGYRSRDGGSGRAGTRRCRYRRR